MEKVEELNLRIDTKRNQKDKGLFTQVSIFEEVFITSPH